MEPITRQQLQQYLADSLGAAETARVEQELRGSEPLRRQLRSLMQEGDRGEHTLGAIWTRNRLSCPTREQLGSYLLQVLEPDLHSYLEFHLETIACPTCQANLADLDRLHEEPAEEASGRRRRIFESSAGYLQVYRAKP